MRDPAEIRYMTSQAVAGAGPAGAGLLYDARRGVYYVRPALRGWLHLICFWVCQIPLAWALAFHTGLGPNGVYVAVVISDSLLAALGILLFRRGKWKQVKV